MRDLIGKSIDVGKNLSLVGCAWMGLFKASERFIGVDDKSFHIVASGLAVGGLVLAYKNMGYSRIVDEANNDVVIQNDIIGNQEAINNNLLQIIKSKVKEQQKVTAELADTLSANLLLKNSSVLKVDFIRKTKIEAFSPNESKDFKLVDLVKMLDNSNYNLKVLLTASRFEVFKRWALKNQKYKENLKAVLNQSNNSTSVTEAEYKSIAGKLEHLNTYMKDGLLYMKEFYKMKSIWTDCKIPLKNFEFDTSLDLYVFWSSLLTNEDRHVILERYNKLLTVDVDIVKLAEGRIVSQENARLISTIISEESKNMEDIEDIDYIQDIIDNLDS